MSKITEEERNHTEELVDSMLSSYIKLMEKCSRLSDHDKLHIRNKLRQGAFDGLLLSKGMTVEELNQYNHFYFNY